MLPLSLNLLFMHSAYLGNKAFFIWVRVFWHNKKKCTSLWPIPVRSFGMQGVVLKNKQKNTNEKTQELMSPIPQPERLFQG